MKKLGRRNERAQWTSKNGLAKIKEFAAKGMNKVDIASCMGIAYQTLLNWQGSYPILYETMEKGYEEYTQKTLADVESALEMNALGHQGKQIKHIKIKHVEYADNGKKLSENEEIVPVEDTVYIPPNVMAQMYYLQNKAPDKWQDKRNVVVTANVSFAELLAERRMKRAEVIEPEKLEKPPKTQV